MVALVAGARSKGLGEKPVDAKAVRDEADRKHCFDSNNFSGSHIGGMKGFNKSGRKHILVTSKWVGEFQAAIDQALGRSAAES